MMVMARTVRMTVVVTVMHERRVHRRVIVVMMMMVMLMPVFMVPVIMVPVIMTMMAVAMVMAMTGVGRRVVIGRVVCHVAF